MKVAIDDRRGRCARTSPLLLAFLAEAGRPIATRVEALSPVLRQILADRRYAETDMHTGAAFDFPQFWVSVQYVLAGSECSPDRFASAGAYLHDGRDFAPWLLRAALVRCLIASYVHRAHREYPSFERYLRSEVFPRLRSEHGIVPEHIATKAIRELRCGRFDSPPKETWATLHLIYRQLVSRLTELPGDLDCIGLADPVGGILKWREGCRELPDACWTRIGADHLDRLDRAQRAPDLLLEQLLWQTVRLRCLLFRHVSQRPLDRRHSLVHSIF